MKTDRVFLAEYKKLNSEQKKAVNMIEGPLMIIAGPGTGKTKILTLRIANILRKTDTDPENILALTFTESGVYSMRKNLVDIMGSAAYRVNIFTFHGFCNGIIQEYPEYFGRIIGSQHIGAPEQIKTIEDILKMLKLKALKPSGNIYFYVYPLLKKISELKRDAVSPKELTRILSYEEQKIKNEFASEASRKGALFVEKKKHIDRNKELLRVYKEYEKVLENSRFYDYDDMIMETLKTLKKEKDLLLTLQEKYQYILADEHQDANRAQNELLATLASFHAPYPNLFVVGDEKQAIFRFQGASLDNFLYFKKKYPKAMLIYLSLNYRSTQLILDAAGSLIKKGALYNKEEKLIASKKEKGKQVSIFEFSESYFEERFVGGKVKELIKAGVLPSEIAILYRDNKDAFSFASILSKMNIPFSIESDEDILSDPFIEKLVLLLSAVYHLGNEEEIISILHAGFLKFDPFSVYAVAQYARANKKHVFQVLSSYEALKNIDMKEEDRKLFHDFSKKFLRWKKAAHNMPCLSFLELLVHESGFLDYIISLPEANEIIGKLTDLYEYISEIQKNHLTYSVSDLLSRIEIHRRYNVHINRSKDPLLLNSVRLMTAHRSKGLEFSHVFIVYAFDKHWGGRSGRNYFPITYKGQEIGDSLSDERRLFYVALTRGKEHVYVSYSRMSSDGKQRLPSQFIEEIEDVLKKKENVSKMEEKFAIEKAHIFKKEKKSTHKAKNKEYLNALFVKQGLSVTALNNYLKCPWRYFYVNLIRIPSVQSASQMYGSAIHVALEILFESVRKKDPISKNAFLDHFKHALKKFPFEKHESVVFLARGKKALSGYYDTYKKLWHTRIINEFQIKGVLLSDIRLTGMLDKLEILDDEGHVNVVDYKTGVPKSRNEIEGKTKRSTGDYKRQIIFYKLLLDLFSDKKFVFQSGEIDFVEPDSRGRYKKERFFVTEKEVSNLENLIKKVSREILALSFWDNTCGEKGCPYCVLRFSKEQI